MQPKTHRIETTSSGLLSLPVMLLLLLIASIVMLGILGDGSTTSEAHAKEAIPEPATVEGALLAAPPPGT